MYSSFSKLLFVAIGLPLLLDAVKAPCPAQRRQPTSNTTPAEARRIYTSIRQVDFNNFVYSIPSPVGITASIKGEQITMRQGVGTGSSNPESGCEYRLESVSYGYLISDEGPDAVIVLGCSLSPGSGYNNVGYIYGLLRGQPALLAQFEGGFRGHLIVGAGIAYASLIVIKDNWDEDPPLQVITYKWNGRKLLEAGRSAIRRIQ